jgi:hypothetical protein
MNPIIILFISIITTNSNMHRGKTHHPSKPESLLKKVSERIKPSYSKNKRTIFINEPLYKFSPYTSKDLEQDK